MFLPIALLGVSWRLISLDIATDQKGSTYRVTCITRFKSCKYESQDVSLSPTVSDRKAT